VRKFDSIIIRWIIATSLSGLGDSFTKIAMSIMTYNITSSGKYAAIVFLAGVIPSVIFGPFIGVRVDNSNKRDILIKSNLVSIIILLFLIIIPGNAWLYFIGNFILATISLFFRTSSIVILPELVNNKDNLIKINSIYSLTNKLGRAIGMVIAGFVSEIILFRYLFVFDLLTFLICIFIIISIHELKYIYDSSKSVNAKESYITKLQCGIKIYKDNRILATSLFFFGLVTMCDGVIFPQLVVYVKEYLNNGGQLLGQIQSIFLIGTIVGQAIIYYTPTKINEKKGLKIGVLFSIIFVILLGVINSVFLTFVLLFLYGAFGALIMISWITLSQKEIDIETRGRGTAFADAIVKIFNLIGIGFSIIIYDYITIAQQFTIIGSISLILFCILLSLYKKFRL